MHWSTFIITKYTSYNVCTLWMVSHVHFVQTDEPEVINFLLTTEIIPLCLRIMESGSELSKTVSYSVF